MGSRLRRAAAHLSLETIENVTFQQLVDTSVSNYKPNQALHLE